jgi:hypothetical protein
MLAQRPRKAWPCCHPHSRMRPSAGFAGFWSAKQRVTRQKQEILRRRMVEKRQVGQKWGFEDIKPDRYRKVGLWKVTSADIPSHVLSWSISSPCKIGGDGIRSEFSVSTLIVNPRNSLPDCLKFALARHSRGRKGSILRLSAKRAVMR